MNYLNLSAAIDIVLVALLFYAASFLIRGTQSIALVRGMALVFGVMILVSNLFNLLALRWLLDNMLTVLAVAIPVIFQPELRRIFERLGRAGFFVGRQPHETRRAKIIDAEGELQAAERLAQAGEILSKRPESMQLRYLGTLLNIAGERSNTIVFPLPMGDLVKALGVGEKKG